MVRPKVFIVEDDADILQLLTFNLHAAGFDISSSRDGYEALALIRQDLPDAVLLDLMLPGMDGLDVCKELKRGQETRRIPVIMLTARSEEIDRIVGLELGADDYVVKPFSPRELILRIRAVLRRAGPREEAAPVWQKGGLRLESDAHRALVDGEEVSLTATEFKLLLELVRNEDKVQTRDQLLDRVWGYRFEGYARTVDTHIRRLRQKLGRYADMIETIRGVGYRFHG